MPHRWRVAGINFDHFHMGDLLRMVHNHPGAQLVGISDEQPERMREAQQNFSIPEELVFTDYRECLEKARPEVVILCPSTATHAEWVEKVAPFGAHLLVEKPFAASLQEADRMIAAADRAGVRLAINWPMRWYRSHALAHELATQQALIGEITEVHYYAGNRGPLYHGADKVELEPTPERKAASWFYKRAEGGGSLLDYLGYGTTLGSWYLGGRAPLEIGCLTWATEGLEVDEHSITVARYAFGLSKFETRWGTFTDPWTHQPQPKCGFVLKGTEGTLSSYDNDEHITVQTRDCPAGKDIPAPVLQPPESNPVQYFLHCLDVDKEVEGPLSPALSRLGQQIVDTAVLAAREKRTVPLIG